MGENSGKILIPESYSSEMAWEIGMVWELIKEPLIVPLLTICVYICLAMSVMVFIERIYMGAVIVVVKLLGKKPEKRYKWEAMKDDLEEGNAAFPMVLVQIPMCNEKEVYKISIGAASNLSWPADRLLIQVLDDSTDLLIKDMIEKECLKWASKGVNIRYQIRERKGGFKAGLLKQGLEHDYVKDCEYVAIFDSDFRPEPNFLRRSVPFLIHNPDIALVQARWRFVNADECLLTRMQEMSFDYHFMVEQEAGSATHAFFGFNGTGGIWRIAAINDAGGWNHRTTVEDMDLAVRAGLRGWKFLYLGDLQVYSELPSTFKAFRLQQHRWSSGPANLFRKTMIGIATNKKITLYKKMYLMYSFFFMRKMIVHFFTFFFYCVVLPLSVMVPEVYVPKWGAIYLPSIITTLNSLGTPRSLHLLFCWVLFENAMSFHRSKAVVIGLLEAKRANEWVVTEKLGDKLKYHSKASSKKYSVTKAVGERIQVQELGLAVFLFFCGCYNFLYGKDNYFVYLFLQVITFTVVGFGYVGTFLPPS
ncbi:glucomannan 4-beta-mannosyltransferase 2-like [Salvia miltiorrhiza]|uniref:glucomannan 4-beta-mannosyltransferase 2-like n=1 Tax=Salvia miltiorrhiza TaxID=226208 RepID=UPI0025AD8F46|nr:glucomannan 4-beta-mannosyltransferase 2-like [Salvia miltiorrhiza]